MPDNQPNSKSGQKALIGAGLAAAAGTAAFLLSRRTGSSGAAIEEISDAPDHVWRRGTGHYDPELVGKTVTIDRPREQLYERWRDFTRFPAFMENVERVEKLGETRSRWAIKAPGGSSVELITRITEEKAGQAIAWSSEPESEIETSGRVEFADAGPGRGTVVRLIIRYSPPGGIIGKGLAKLLQREPHIQARRDLRRFKQLMETGEITTNASPSARESESPTEPRV
ncbi:MAG TPA: SRPBCC family protein [Sphingomicrobium sp.]|nr:SRPBCC family protein [Sphingomicrobium sp.]